MQQPSRIRRPLVRTTLRMYCASLDHHWQAQADSAQARWTGARTRDARSTQLQDRHTCGVGGAGAQSIGAVAFAFLASSNSAPAHAT